MTAAVPVTRGVGTPVTDGIPAVTSAPATDAARVGDRSAAAPPYPSTVVLTSVELMALLDLRPGPAADVARERLGLGAPDRSLADAGAVSLLGRGYLTPGPEPSTGAQTPAMLRPVGPGRVIAHVLTTPGTWRTVALGDPDGISVSLVVEAGAVGIALDPSPDGSVAVTALPADHRADRAVAETTIAHLDEHRPAIASVTVHPASGGEASLAASRGADGRWWTHTAPGRAPTATGRADLQAELAALADLANLLRPAPATPHPATPSTPHPPASTPPHPPGRATSGPR